VTVVQPDLNATFRGDHLVDEAVAVHVGERLGLPRRVDEIEVAFGLSDATRQPRVEVDDVSVHVREGRSPEVVGLRAGEQTAELVDAGAIGAADQPGDVEQTVAADPIGEAVAVEVERIPRDVAAPRGVVVPDPECEGCP